MQTQTLIQYLEQNQEEIGPVVPHDLSAPNVCRLDLTANNQALAHANLTNTQAFDELINEMLQIQNATIGVGGYLEDRVIYRRSQHFDALQDKRSVHLGIDIWTAAFTPILAPLDGRVHSFQDNNNFGDYGPTIILEHELEEGKFYTLYGHLTRTSLQHLHPGQIIKKGEEFAQFGPFPENGDWPPHLHFQLMTDLLGMMGDFPGVCTLKQQDQFSKICLDPNLILKSKVLA
ncbi:peptidoglycan DD-metalloendopeptidase family protein [Adhaeribacter aquaticus]|uniref:peptidoglycan DD-metalloendopeptidase family protein n=1 Tax=Adhaeribacter aquaticus TaxID=299567 RepID=UPI0005503691|nr:peptidoglycan DD-metalloendopeptidase family protein [Adhaeribacter aquaticus]